MNLDEVRRAGIAVEAGAAFDVDAEQGGEFVEQAAVDGEVALFRIEVAEVEALEGEFEFVLVARGEHEVAGLFLGVRVAAEEAAEVALEAVGEVIERNLPPELGGGDKDEEVFLPALAGGGEGRFAEAVDEELEGLRQGAAGLADFREAFEFVVARQSAEFEDPLPEDVEEFAVGLVGIDLRFQRGAGRASGTGIPSR